MNVWKMTMNLGITMVAVYVLATAGAAHAALVAYYTFDTDFTDSAGSTAENGVALGGASIQSGTVMFGSGALELDGNDDQVEITFGGELGFALDTDNYTIAGWVNIRGDSTNGEHVLVTHDQGSGTGRVWLSAGSPAGVLSGEDKPLTVLGGFANGGIPKAADSITRDEWNHLAVTVDNSGSGLVSLYVNGVLADTRPKKGEAASGGVLRIGHHKAAFGDDLGVNGFVDDLRVYDTALSAEEIAALLPSSLAADFDSDGDVDSADFLLWQQGLGDTYDANDLENWESEFGTVSALATISAVPEPGSLWMASVLMVLAARCRPPREIETITVK